MKRLTLFVLLAISTVLPCLAQQQEVRETPRPGPFLTWGPVHVIRCERVTVTYVDGEIVEGPRIPTLIITYSEDGTQQEQTIYAPDGSIAGKKRSLYDQGRRPLETTDFNSKGDKQLKWVYKYDNLKRLIEEIQYRPDDSVLKRRTIVYEAGSGISESIVYGQDGAIISKRTTNQSYSRGVTERQAAESETYFFNSGRTVKDESKFTYTPNGVQVYERRQNGDLLDRTESVQLGKNGAELIIYSPDSTIKRRERAIQDFDSHHNIIKIVTSVAEGDSTDFKPVEIAYRTIEYYE